MKKILIIIGIIVVLLLSAFTIIPMFYKDQIADIIKEKANEQLTCEMDFQDVGISVFRDFPDVTVSIDGLTLVNQEPFAGDTLVHLDAFRVTVDVFSLIAGESIEIVSILLDQPSISLLVLEDGRPNWNIMKETDETVTTEESQASAFGLTLQEYQIRNADIFYADFSTEMFLTAQDFNHKGSGDFTQDLVYLKTDTKINSLNSGVGDVTYLNNSEVHFIIETMVDMENLAIDLKENQLRLNDFIFNLDGSIKIGEETTSVDLAFGTEETDFKNLISLIPTVYQDNFSKLEASGQFGFQGKAIGNYSEKEFPKVDFKFEANNGKLKLPQMPHPIDQFEMELFVVNPGGSIENTLISLRKFHFEMDNQPFDARLNVSRPFSTPTASGFLRGNLDLGNVKELVTLEENVEIDGLIKANLEFSSTQKKELEVNGKGKVEFTGILYSSPELPGQFSLKNGSMSFTPEKVTLDRFDAKIGDSDMQATGELQNVLSYMMHDKELTGNLSITSNLFDLNPWMEGPSTTLSAVELPGNITFLMAAQFKEVLFDNLKLQNVNGTLVLEDKVLRMDGLDMDALGGKMSATGRYDTRDPQVPIIDFDFAVNQMSFSNAYNSFVTVQTFAPIANHLHGDFDAKIRLNSQLDKDLMPIWQNFTGRGKLDIAAASLTDFTPFNQVAKVIKWDQLQNPSLKNFHPSFSIENGKMKVDPFTVNIQNTDMVVSGTYGIDKSIDYDLVVKMPASKLKGQTAAALTNLVGREINLGTSETVDVLVSLGGTYDKPTVKASIGDMAKSVTSGLKGAAVSELKDKKDELKQGLIQSLTKKPAKKDTTATSKQDLEKAAKEKLEKEKKEAEKKLKNKLKNLLKKKKN